MVDKSPLDYLKGLSKNEVIYLENTTPLSSTSQALLTKLLNLYELLAPAMVPPILPNVEFKKQHLNIKMDDFNICRPTLWHPYLDVNNIFVDPSSKKITQIIGWQSAQILPLYLQAGVPPIFEHTGKFYPPGKRGVRKL